MAPIHINPPFRADHIGSLLRPASLLQKRQQLHEGKVDKAELIAEEDRTIAEIVEMQREVGIKGITDGEFRRFLFFDGVFDTLEGMKFHPQAPLEWFMPYVPVNQAIKDRVEASGAAGFPSLFCEGKLRRTKSFYKDQFEYLKTITSPETHKNIKITMCAPEFFHLRHGEYSYPKNVYANDDEYFADITIAYREEIQELYSLGCRNIQFDDPLLPYFCAESVLSGMKARGVDPETVLNTYFQTYQNILKDRPQDMNIGMHLCRGNFRERNYVSEGGYEKIAIRLFNELPLDCYYLEYDDGKSGTFEPLRHLPKGKVVILGLITTKYPELENKEDLKARVHEAASIIASGTEPRSFEDALQQICISPQCGFASSAIGCNVSPTDMEKKLSLLVQTSKEIWADA